MNLFNDAEFEHECVAFCHDAEAGLRAVIAIHNSNLGPAIGGCRMSPYPTERAALTDVLRLSKGMTYKCAIAGIPFGGGKAVIIGDPATDKTEALLEAMGRAVDRFNGRYITSFDAGTTLEDVAIMGRATPHIGGVKEGAGNASLSTAKGVFECIKASLNITTPDKSIAEVSVAIQGAGNVGGRLASLLAEAGASIIISDIDEGRAREVAQRTDAQVVSHAAILQTNADIFSPCALGGVLNEATIEILTAKTICGGANNQLSDLTIADTLRARGVFYCPDFVANAGGIIDLHYQLNESASKGLNPHLENLGQTLRTVYELSESEKLSMAHAAERLAEHHFKTAYA